MVAENQLAVAALVDITVLRTLDVFPINLYDDQAEMRAGSGNAYSIWRWTKNGTLTATPRRFM